MSELPSLFNYVWFSIFRMQE